MLVWVLLETRNPFLKMRVSDFEDIKILKKALFRQQKRQQNRMILI
jgi:hypothetical protein